MSDTDVYLVGIYGSMRPVKFFSHEEARRYADWVMKTYPKYGTLWVVKEKKNEEVGILEASWFI